MGKTKWAYLTFINKYNKINTIAKCAIFLVIYYDLIGEIVMGYQQQMVELIQKYLKEVHSQELSIDEIESRPHWKKVWYWWKALEYYEGNEMPNLTLEEVKKIYGE